MVIFLQILQKYLLSFERDKQQVVRGRIFCADVSRLPATGNAPFLHDFLLRMWEFLLEDKETSLITVFFSSLQI